MALTQDQVLEREHVTRQDIRWSIDKDGDIVMKAGAEHTIYLTEGDINEMRTAQSDLYYAVPSEDNQ